LEYGMPPTTGIGPGIERMAMIFTGQENIDDVIFFPIMRPAVSPINASVYGLQDVQVAPVEDVALSVEEFQKLCEQGALKPHAKNIVVRPHVRLWKTSGEGNGTVATGHAEVEGFLPNSLLRLAAQAGPQEKPKQFVIETLEKAVPAFLRMKFPNCEVVVSPATFMGQ
jgi:hypothetical protein